MHTIELTQRIEDIRNRMIELTTVAAKLNEETRKATRVDYYAKVMEEAEAWQAAGDAAKELLQLLTGAPS